MKTRLPFGLIIFLLGLFILGVTVQVATANYNEHTLRIMHSVRNQQEAQTPIPADTASTAVIETPESRVLPPVGRNAGLVIGASLLVLIIIGGVLSSRRKPKH